MIISMISVKRYTEGTLDRVYFDQEFYDLILQAAQRMLGGYIGTPPFHSVRIDPQDFDEMRVALESWS